ncbi:putative disease resistance protein RGA3 [Mercurialis annua]|uniref:putative disease resistance protein RGA3 n=1 Tax=Mercurialis annua TaxID=3986 RepID=UPI0024AFD388|nr:putative disease resistance protein RGA3 [Mercurialis annua]
MTATSPICYIGRLSDDDSWSLFERRAFGLGRKEEVAHLETIGRDIVDMCGGVPLAIKALGSLLRLKRKENEWISVKDSELWNLSNDGSMILSALKLSYNHLALHVKRCFAFCSIFPKDRIMERDMLIGLWMANGFIPCETQIDLYNKGHEVFEELVWRSFFQDVKDEHVTGTITCKMHDLIHDLAQSITVDECKLIKSDKVLVVPKTIRHMSMYVNSQQAFPRGNKLFRGQQLRSFLWVGLRDRHQEAFPQGSHFIGGHKFISSNLRPGYPDRHRQVSFYMSGQKRLRVLDLSRSRLGKFPMPISSLKHLRYLDFSNSSIKILPELIISLQNLQTLNLRDCYKLCKLPRGLKYMKNLIHLDILGCSSLTYMPGEIGQLTCLRKLSDFIVGKDKGHHIGELKELNLGGELSIHKIQYVTSCGDAKTANLMGKKELSSLRLLWSQEEEEYSSNTFEEVLDGLQPHSNLKKLTIYYYRGSHYWMMDLLLPNLIQIDLVCCDGCKHLPPFGKLKFLRELEICGMNGVKCIENEIYGNGECSFPSLERLRLHCMGGLEELLMQVVAGRNVFPILESLVIIFCPKLVELPSMPSLRTLNICGGSRMLLRSVEKFGFVTSLSINGLDNSINLESLQNQLDKLPYLKSFKVEGIPELESLPERLSFLETLHVSSCGIKSFPSINGLCGYSSLRSLCFRSCSEFVGLSEGLRHLSGLEDLRLQELPKLSSLPDSIGYLTALRTLVISSCEGLSCLPNEIENLTSLSSLEIESCRNLMCLPDGIRNLETLRG